MWVFKIIITRIFQLYVLKPLRLFQSCWFAEEAIIIMLCVETDGGVKYNEGKILILVIMKLPMFF